MMHFSIDSGYSRKNQRYDWNQHGAGSSSFKKNGVQRSDWKRKRTHSFTYNKHNKIAT